MNENAFNKFARDLSNLLKARFPYIYISTWEEDRVLTTINSICTDETIIKTPRNIFTWSLTTGITNNEMASRKETKDPLKALEFIEHFSDPAVFIFKDFHIYFSAQNRCFDHEIIRKLRDLIFNLKNSPKPKNIIFISPNLLLPDELQKDITILEFSLPTIIDIQNLLDELVAVNQKSGRIQISINPTEKEKLAKAALGLTYQEAENAFAHAMVEDGCLNSKDIDIVLEEKCQIIKKTGILEYIKSDLKLDDIGGLQNLKRWLIKRNKSWMDSAKKYCLPEPKGILLTGIPGCGKSMVAKTISAMWHLPLLRLDIGRIFSGIVGSSEENLRRAIKTAEAIAPAVLWIDEIEKGFSGIGSTGDSGVATRIFGTFLTWMQEKATPVFVVATANNISLLPPELLRKGRFDEIFFIDLPTQKERIEIFKLHINKRLVDASVIGDFSLTEDILEKLSAKTEGFVGSEIEQIVVTALFDAFYEDRSIRFEDFEKAVKNTVPLSVTQAEQISSLREWANVRAVAATPKEDRLDYVIQNEILNENDKDSEKKFKDPIKETRGGRAIDF